MQMVPCYLREQDPGSPAAQTGLPPYAAPGKREIAFPIKNYFEKVIRQSKKKQLA